MSKISKLKEYLDKNEIPHFVGDEGVISIKISDIEKDKIKPYLDFSYNLEKEYSSKKKIYISGRITGLDIDYAKSKFKEAQDALMEMDYIPVNPFDIAPQNDNLTWLDYMRIDIKELVDCDGIMMLDNWEESEGAKLELQIAKGLKMKVYYFKIYG